MIPFAIAGAGWRTQFFLRIAQACPDRFRVTGVAARDPARVAALTAPFGVPACAAVDDLPAGDPLFIVTSVPWGVNPGLIKRFAERGVPVLSETPPATTVEELRALHALVEGGARIQVAEQYHLQPLHAARIAFARSGRLGTVWQAQVSVCHGYHGISLLRRLLGIGFEPAQIAARAFRSAIVRGPDRDGPPRQESLTESEQVIAQLDFGDRLAVYDFVGDQYFSYVRGQRVLVRGDRGEIIDGRATYLRDHLTPVRVEFLRHSAGPEGNLEGHYLKGIQVGEEWIYRNPLAPGRLSDDEIAIGDCLLRMADYARGGPGFYSLAEACQDRYLDILIHEAVASGRTVVAERQAWAP